MSKHTPKSDRRTVQLTLPMSSLRSQRLESGSCRTTEAVQDALNESLRRCGLSREVVAEELSRLTGHEVSVHTLNNWAAPSKEDRPTPLQFLRALLEISGSPALAEAALRGTGYKLLTPDQVPLYELGRITAEDKARAKRKRAIWEKIG